MKAYGRKEWKRFSKFLDRLFRSRLFLIGMLGVFIVSIITMFLFLTGQINKKSLKLIFWLIQIPAGIVGIVSAYFYIRYIWGRD